MTLKQACAYLRKDKVILGPVSVTTAGVGVAVEPFLCIEVENIGKLGKGVLATLEKSQHGVPHPKQDQWKALLAPMLKAAGVKSWSSFAKSASVTGPPPSIPFLRRIHRRGHASVRGQR